MSNVPGTLDCHLTVTPQMRRCLPMEDLVMEMADHVEESVTELLEDENEKARIHVAVTVER